MATCNKINAGFDICAAAPIAVGVEDIVYLFNFGDFIFTYSPTNPLIITGITPVNGAKMYRYIGTNNSFNTTSTSVQTNVGPRYEEQVDFNIAGISSVIKGQIMNMGFGNLQAIVINNYVSSDSAVELFGAVTGLNDQGSKRVANDENFQGGYEIVLKNRNKLREPFLPRCISIPIIPQGLPGTPPTVNSAIIGTQIPTGVAVTGALTGGALAAATYYYKVVSVDSQGTTLGSTEVSVVNTGTTSSNILTWAGAPGATSYRVYRGTAAGAESVFYVSNTTNFTDVGGASTAGTVPVTNTAIKATAIPSTVSATPSTTGGALATATYYYVVTAVDSKGETLGSTEVNAAVTGPTGSVLVQWGAVTGAIAYNIYRGTAAGQESVYFSTAALSFTDTNVQLPATFASTLAAINSLAA